MNIQALDPDRTDGDINKIASYLAAQKQQSTHKKVVIFQLDRLSQTTKKLLHVYLAAAQHKVSDLTDDMYNMHNSIHQLIYLMAEYRDYKLLTIDADDGDNDEIMNFMIFWRKDKDERNKEKTAKKEAKQEKKEAQREAKREVKEARNKAASLRLNHNAEQLNGKSNILMVNIYQMVNTMKMLKEM